jgi:3-dehydrosphinganine reductase
MPFISKDKLVVISGGSQGLGASIAKFLVQEGANVYIVARTESKLVSTVAALEEHRVSEEQLIKHIAADVSKPDQCDRVFSQLPGPPDIVMCLAGTATPGIFIEHSTEHLTQTWQTGYLTTLHFAHSALRSMAPVRDTKEQRHLVLCSSVLALFSYIGYSSYAPSKAAIRALADVLRHECIPYNIKVSCIFPGNMATEGYEIENLTKPEISRTIEGPSHPLEPDVCAKSILKDLRNGQQMIFTDFIGWVLSTIMLGASPRNWNILQTPLAILLALFAPIWNMLIIRDVKNYYREQKKKK